jgi:multidrug transporter EmrE-like cation transporter
MSDNRLSIALPILQNPSAIVVGMIVLNLIFNVISNASFKLSALAPTWRGVLIWQVVGNLTGLVTVIALTILLRHMPLSIAFPLTTGLAVLGVQVFASKWYFHEPTSSVQWLGALLIVAGIFLVQRLPSGGGQ